MKKCSSSKLVSSHTSHKNITLWYQNTVDNIYSCKCWGFTFFLFHLLFKLFTISMQQAVRNSVNVNGCKCHNHSEFAIGGKIRVRSEKLDRSRRTGSWSAAHRLQAVEICLYQQLGALHRVLHCVGSSPPTYVMRPSTMDTTGIPVPPADPDLLCPALWSKCSQDGRPPNLDIHHTPDKCASEKSHLTH